MTDNNVKSHWQIYQATLHSGVVTIADEPPEVCHARRQQLEADPEAWFRYYFPKYAWAPPATFHKEATQRIIAHTEWCEVRMWSRELAKSTRTMMEVLYLVLAGHPPEAGQQQRRRKRCVLLISNSLDNATRLLAPYKVALESNERLLQDYGRQQTGHIWTTTEFMAGCGASFRAIGAGQSPRGTRNEEARPDIILFDDLDTDADCLNPEQVARKWRWIEEAAIGTRSVSAPTTILFCGNRIATDCCVQRASEIADHTDVVNIRNKEGLSAWPEKNTEADIERVLSQKSYAAQQKEYFNNPVMEGAVFSALPYKPPLHLQQYDILLCYTDPSYKTTNDYKATVLVGRAGAEYHIIKAFVEKATTSRMIDWHYMVMDLVGANACYYYMEQVFLQDALVKEVADAHKRTGRLIPIRGDTRRKPDKYLRIESLLEPMVRNGQLYLNENERYNPHMLLLAEQFRVFGPGSNAHDDGPDAVEGAVWLISERHSARGKPRIETGHNTRYPPRGVYGRVSAKRY
jgi:predicted phage terminase large subunit-like protein